MRLPKRLLVIALLSTACAREGCPGEHRVLSDENPGRIVEITRDLVVTGAGEEIVLLGQRATLPAQPWDAEALERGMAGFAGGLAIRSAGDVPVRIELRRAGQPKEAAKWDRIVDVSLRLRGTTLSIGRRSTQHQFDLPVPGGTYRVRVATAKPEGGGERHLVQLWPAAIEPAVVWRRPAEAATPEGLDGG